MHRCFFLMLILCGSVFCDECVTFNFEEDFENHFTNAYGVCRGLAMWDVGNYSTLNIEAPHSKSTSFISPRSSLSCISSFKFSITARGRLEVNLFMVPASPADQISVIAFQSVDGGFDLTVGNAALSAMGQNFVPGWRTITVNLVGFGSYEGYVTIMGIASPASYMLVDSFRYIPPTLDENSCVIYPEDEETTFSPNTTTEEPPSTTELTSTITPNTEFPTETVSDSPSLITTPATVVPDIMIENEPLTTLSTIEMSTTPTTEIPSTNMIVESTGTTSIEMLATESTTEILNTVVDPEPSEATNTPEMPTTPTTMTDIYTTPPVTPPSTSSSPNMPADFCMCVARCFYQQPSTTDFTNSPTIKPSYFNDRP